MQITNVLVGKKCKLFPPTLGHEGLNCYAKLPDYSIECFATLEAKFLKHFATSIYKKPTIVVNGLYQIPTEFLRDYLQRFTQCCHEVNELEDNIIIQAFKSGLHPGLASNELAISDPKTVAALLKIKNFIHKEDHQEASRVRYNMMNKGT